MAIRMIVASIKGVSCLPMLAFCTGVNERVIANLIWLKFNFRNLLEIKIKPVARFHLRQTRVDLPGSLAALAQAPVHAEAAAKPLLAAEKCFFHTVRVGQPLLDLSNQA